jgi:hypothetical protein
MRFRTAPLLAALLLVAAGCGGGGGGGNALPAAADVVPASAPVLISIKTDFTSPQWTHALALVHKFPGAGDLLRQARLEAGNVDFEHDVKPALGPEVDIVWLDFANGGNDVVGLTQPKSKQKFAALIAKENKTGTKALTTEVGDWTVVADARAKLDSFRRASSGDKLAKAAAFKDALSHLDENAIVRAYVSGPAVQQQLDGALQRSGAPAHLTRGLARMESISGAGFAEGNGVRAEAALATQPAATPKAYSPSLADSLPSGALFYLSTGDLAAPTRAILKLVARSRPNFERQLGQVESVVGLTLDKDIYPLISHEQAVAVYPAMPIPKIVVLVKVPDQNRAEEVVGRILQIAELGGLNVETLQVGAVRVREVSEGRSGVHGFVAVTGGKLIFTTARDLLPALIQGKGPKLADDPRYRKARSEADMPGKVVAMAYGDLADGLPFAFRLAEANGSVVPPEARPNTRPLKESLLYATQDGNRFRVSGFLAIK